MMAASLYRKTFARFFIQFSTLNFLFIVFHDLIKMVSNLSFARVLQQQNKNRFIHSIKWDWIKTLDCNRFSCSTRKVTSNLCRRSEQVDRKINRNQIYWKALSMLCRWYNSRQFPTSQRKVSASFLNPCSINAIISILIYSFIDIIKALQMALKTEQQKPES